MVRFFTSAFAATALLATATFAAPLHRRSKEPQPQMGEMTEIPVDKPMEMPSMREPPKMEKPPKMKEPMMDEPPKMMEPPMDEPPKMDKPPLPTYGSGSNNWGSGYDDCVQQCIGKYGAPPSHEWTPKEPSKTGDETSGAIHTVMVAPIDGVLRYLPFALNATIGDTVRFVWTGTKDHSVTMGSELNLCGKNEGSDAFDSGLLNGKDGEQTFDIKVETSEPRYFYCSAGDGGHCSKGMWGIINPKSALGDKDTVGGKMNEWVEGNPDLKAAWNYVQGSTKDTPADTWGNSISTQGIPEDQYVNLASNTVWTRANLAANPGMQNFGRGAAKPDGSPIKIVGDLNTLLASTIETGTNTTEPAAPPTPSASTSDASLISRPSSVLVALGVLLASVFML